MNVPSIRLLGVLALTLVSCGARSQLITPDVDPCSNDACVDVVPEACGPLPAAYSCLALHQRCPSLPSGAYPLSTSGTAWTAWCEMEADGGGWTLLLKTDGRRPTFSFDASLWTDNSVLNVGSTDLSQSEAKFAGFSVLSFGLLRVGLAPFGGEPSWLLLGVSGPSLRDALAHGHVATNLGRGQWLGLVPGSDLQPNCNVEGLNAIGDELTQSHVRIGFIANQENNCGSPDSYIGIGGLDSRTPITTGAYCNNQWQCVHGAQVDLPRFGFVFAR